MTYLLDTHVIVWMAEGDPRLSRRVTIELKDPANRLLVNVASLWEIAIKVGIGELHLTEGFEALNRSLKGERIDVIGIDPAVLSSVISLPMHHRDPFDRLLAATALNSSYALISADSVFDMYGVNRIW